MLKVNNLAYAIVRNPVDYEGELQMHVAGIVSARLSDSFLLNAGLSNCQPYI